MREREMLNRLYYKDMRRMTGDELYVISKGRKIQFNTDVDNGTIDLVIQKEKWATESMTWKGVADILNEWQVTDQLRRAIINLDDNEVFSIPLVVPGYLPLDEDDLMI